jgi:hypothetical protein
MIQYSPIGTLGGNESTAGSMTTSSRGRIEPAMVCGPRVLRTQTVVQLASETRTALELVARSAASWLTDGNSSCVASREDAGSALVSVPIQPDMAAEQTLPA